VGFFSVVSDFGLNQIQIRETSIHRSDDIPAQYVNASVNARMILGFISFLIIITIAIFSNKPADVKLLLLFLGLSMYVTNLFGSYTAVLIGLEKFAAFGIISSIYVFTYSSLAIVTLLMGFGLIGIGISQMSAAIVVAIAGMIYVSIKILKVQWRFNLTEGKQIFKLAAPLGLTAILTNIYYRADFVMLSYIRGDQEVGYYNAAYTVVNTLLLFAVTFTSTLLPRLSALFATDFAILGKLYRTAFKYLLFMGMGSAIGAMLLASPILKLLFGEKYLPGAGALSILIWASALMFVNSLQGSLLVASNMKRNLVHLTGAAAAGNLILNILLIPRFGIRGAAAATVFSEIIAGSWSFVLLRKHNSLRYIANLIIKALAASLIMAFVVTRFPNLHILLRVLSGIATYAIGLIVFRGFNSADIKIIKEVLGIRVS
jgi:O-antigen/teichoic acid export membrane protein